ncbi:MAG: hypothetical protein Q8920_05855 [Bacillota bacterium]|nr:hypothetical protein [Bacillota bacterium]
MIVIIKKKFLLSLLPIILAALTGIVLYIIFCSSDNTDVSKDVSLKNYITSPAITQPSKGYNFIEIYDINKNEVVKTIAATSEIQSKAERYLKGIAGIYSKLSPVPDSGYMVKIPLEPPVELQNQWLSGNVYSMILILPDKESPYIALLDEESRILFCASDSDPKELLDSLK